MSDTKFTKGSWEVSKKWKRHVLYAADHSIRIAEVADGSNSEGDYNSHLIAAAPDMYDLLEGVLFHHEFDLIPEYRESIRLTLAKARGETS